VGRLKSEPTCRKPAGAAEVNQCGVGRPNRRAWSNEYTSYVLSLESNKIARADALLTAEGSSLRTQRQW